MDLTDDLAWDAFTKLIRFRYSYWSRATTKTTSLGGGNQNGFVTDLPNAPNNT
ncbi:hypothetical protein P109_gp08 [Pelagibacter phage HTVC109P]|nr:hypothetical protein P109_gp08 [Pelagibacter phage HTVC109P]